MLTLLFCFAEVIDTLVTAKDAHSEHLVQYGTPDEASVEFDILLNETLFKTCNYSTKELKNEAVLSLKQYYMH